jgi:signal transduction histidine kinase
LVTATRARQRQGFGGPHVPRPQAGPERGEVKSAVLGAIIGACFGATFPVVGVFVAAHGFDFAAAHSSQSILYIVDTAPLVLGAIGWVLGRIYGRLLTTRHEIEEKVQNRTADLAAALSDLQHAQAQLLQAQKLEAIGGLAAGVAHEINTPIQYIGDNARFLAESFTDLEAFHTAAVELGESVKQCNTCMGITEAFDKAMEEADLEYLREELPAAATQALEGVGRVAEIVRALKDFSHPGSDTKSPIDLNKAVENTLAVSRNEWKYVADVETTFDPDLPVVEALGGPINQALLIIIVNAAQALEQKLIDGEKGTIRIATYQDGDAAVVSIEDDAGGIPEAIQGRIFEPFFTTKEVGKGSGQGLAIARSVLVDQHRGDLTFSVVEGVGTTFFLRIPLTEPAT